MVKYSFIAWVTIVVTVVDTGHAQLIPASIFPSKLSQTAPPERWLPVCNGLFGRNNNNNDNDNCPDTCDDYKDQLDAFGPGLTCTCDACSSEYDYALSCDYCNVCFDEFDVCLEISLGSGWTIASETTLTQINTIFSFTSRGRDSASNNIILENQRSPVIERTDIEFNVNDSRSSRSSCRAILDGIECNSCSNFFGIDCFELDCSNVPNGDQWTCLDNTVIRQTSSHPLFGVVTFDSVCLQ